MKIWDKLINESRWDSIKLCINYVFRKKNEAVWFTTLKILKTTVICEYQTLFIIRFCWKHCFIPIYSDWVKF